MNKWDLETDVVVAGYGASGGIAAVTAHDKGSRSIILEKARYSGGCSVLSAGSIFIVQDIKNAVKYFTALSGNRVPAEVIQAFAEGMARNSGLIKELVKVDQATFVTEPADGLYPYPGSKNTFGTIWITKIEGFNGFPDIVSTRNNGQMMFKVIMDNVESRKIPVLYSTRAKELIIDNSDGSIIGLRAESDNKIINIKAKQGVVLACGGFEHNEWMKLQFFQGKPFYSIAPVNLTGDGIIMAQKVGAALWHMWLIHGSYGFKFDEYPVAFRVNLAGPRSLERKIPWIVVDKHFRRYMNEYPPAPQDSCSRPMEVFDTDLLDYPRIPSYMIFDEAGRKHGPLAQPVGFTNEFNYSWSRDNLAEINRGWIIKANSIKELGQNIRQYQKNADVDTSVLEDTIDSWNKSLQKKMDPLFNRPAGTMMPISSPPFYGVPVWPIITNTQGGPVHNARRQIVDSFGKVIPRLYSAGDMGSFFSHLYELGGNLGECFYSGSIAGTSVADEQPYI
ncbi:FAD-binding protein [Chloroflexota bacterium]